MWVFFPNIWAKTEQQSNLCIQPTLKWYLSYEAFKNLSNWLAAIHCQWGAAFAAKYPHGVRQIQREPSYTTGERWETLCKYPLQLGKSQLGSSWFQRKLNQGVSHAWITEQAYQVQVQEPKTPGDPRACMKWLLIGYYEGSLFHRKSTLSRTSHKPLLKR